MDKSFFMKLPLTIGAVGDSGIIRNEVSRQAGTSDQSGGKGNERQKISHRSTRSTIPTLGCRWGASN